jgi:hypothetical protein
MRREVAEEFGLAGRQGGLPSWSAMSSSTRVAERVSPLLAHRILACVGAVVTGTVISLEDGCPVA